MDSLIRSQEPESLQHFVILLSQIVTRFKSATASLGLNFPTFFALVDNCLSLQVEPTEEVSEPLDHLLRFFCVVSFMCSVPLLRSFTLSFSTNSLDTWELLVSWPFPSIQALNSPSLLWNASCGFAYAPTQQRRNSVWVLCGA